MPSGRTRTDCWNYSRTRSRTPSTTPDQKVTVEPTEEGFAVRDDGPGIPPEDRQRVFDAGYSTATDGTGLGLRIVEQVATAHGWDVRLTESRAGGARFAFGGVDE